MTDREAYIVLNLLTGIGPIRVKRLLSLFGSAAAVLRAPTSALARVPGVGSETAQRVAAWKDECDLAAELRLAEQAGVTLLTQIDPEYPEALRAIHDPPLCLYVRGQLDCLSRLERSIAIVGSRRTTRYGVRMARHLATEAAYAGWVVVSGLARGIDTVAHEAVVACEGCTVAVLGGGLARLSPQENVGLARRMVEIGGAVISEFPMTFPPTKHTFPMRNRIISGSTAGTIVVEAGLRSGSLITAEQALEQGRGVYAVPGPADSPQSRGCNRLIKDGAVLTESFSDILEDLGTLPGMGASARDTIRQTRQTEPPAGADSDAAAAFPDLEPFEARIVDSLRRGETDVDTLIRELGEPAHRVLGVLVTLELKQVVRQLPGRRVCLAQGTLA